MIERSFFDFFRFFRPIPLGHIRHAAGWLRAKRCSTAIDPERTSPLLLPLLFALVFPQAAGDDCPNRSLTCRRVRQNSNAIVSSSASLAIAGMLQMPLSTTINTAVETLIRGCECIDAVLNKREEKVLMTTERAQHEQLLLLNIHEQLEMACHYGQELKTPPETLPSGYAALLYLYNLR